MDSILDEIKLMLGYEVDYDPFNVELIGLINSSIRKVNQLGVGVQNFVVTGRSETWDDFLKNSLEMFVTAKTYIFLNVKLLHDPPTNSFLITNIKDEMKELEWRMTIDSEMPVLENKTDGYKWMEYDDVFDNGEFLLILILMFSVSEEKQKEIIKELEKGGDEYG